MCAAATLAPSSDAGVIDEDLRAQLEFMFRLADTNDDGIISLREFQAILRKGPESSPLTTNLKAQLALIKLIEHGRTGEIHLDKFVEVLASDKGREFQEWLEHASSMVL
jgi:Ca2+-binding EF-hand superfamily protein